MQTERIINNIASEYHENHHRYLSRMTESAGYSSKGRIPVYIKTGHILDVGCGSGIMVKMIQKYNPGCKVEGIEPNHTSAMQCQEEGLSVYETTLERFAENHHGEYDTVVFSSVLHEISSYAENEDERFTMMPIVRALGHARNLLKSDGRLVIRDGLKYASNRPVSLTCVNEETKKAFQKFMTETPIPDYNTGIVNGNTITAPADCMKEFLFTYTWGMESWPREIREQFGIATYGIWVNNVRDCGFKIQHSLTNPEEYHKYLAKYFNESEVLQDILAESTIIISADKMEEM